MHRVIEGVLEFRDEYYRKSFKLSDRLHETHVIKVSHRTFYDLMRDCNPAIDPFVGYTTDYLGFTIIGIPLIQDGTVEDYVIEEKK